MKFESYKDMKISLSKSKIIVCLEENNLKELSVEIGFIKSLGFEENDVVVVERNKDEVKTYNFLEVLRSLEGVEGLNIKISHDNELPVE